MSVPDDVTTVEKVCADPCEFAAREETYRQAMLVLQCAALAAVAPAEEFNATTVAVPTTAGGTVVSAANPDRKSVILQNLSTTPVYYGTGTITSSNATLPGVVGAQSPPLLTTAAIKALSSSGTVNISVLEVTN